MEFKDVKGDAFAPKESVADYFVAYAEMINALIRCGVEVTEVRRNDGGPGFHLETSNGEFLALNVIAATGPFQYLFIPPIVPDNASVHQIHSDVHRDPAQWPGMRRLMIHLSFEIAAFLRLIGPSIG